MTNKKLVIFNFRQRGIKTSNEKLGVFILCYFCFANVILSTAKNPGLFPYVVIKKITPANRLGHKREFVERLFDYLNVVVKRTANPMSLISFPL